MKRSLALSLSVSLGVAAIGGIGVAVSMFGDPRRAVLGFIAAYGCGLGIALGALIFSMVFHVTSATWPVVLRPLTMGIAGTMPIFALLFVPIAIGIPLVYPWANANVAAAADESVSEALAHQRQWNQPTFFVLRAVVYLATWIVFASLLRRADAAHDREPTPETALRQRRISAAGLPAMALTLTFASFDWFMSLEPGWVSDMYGLYFFAGGLSASIALVALLAWATEAAGPAHFHALGRLMLMTTIFWAYIGFFQLMLVWIANEPREVTFYVARSTGSFHAVNVVLVVGHFFLPFAALLSRSLKRRAGLLALIAAWIVLMDVVDLTWLVLPAGGPELRLLDAAPFLVVGGVAFAYGLLRYPKGHGVPAAVADDPTLAESLSYESP